MEMFEKAHIAIVETLGYAIKNGMKPDGYWINEDLVTTRAPTMSPELYKEVLWAFHKQLGQFLHDNDIKFLMHSCEKIDEFIPYFIDAGLEVIQPLQANIGMNLGGLKQEYGKDITFWGNICAEKLAGSFEDIEKEIGEKLTTAKKDGGYIYHSDHSIPPNVILKNYLYANMMIEKYGSYNS
jgi:uroporphyrinogen decarboxylase